MDNVRMLASYVPMRWPDVQLCGYRAGGRRQSGGKIMNTVSRRHFLSLGAAGLGMPRDTAVRRPAPAATVALARCRSYGPDLLPTLTHMFDQLGGLGRLVSGKTVVMKLNLTGAPTNRLGNRPAGVAQWVHPAVVGTVIHLMDEAGARRVRLVEGGASTAEPLAEYMYQAGWNPLDFVRAGRRVEFENTNWLGYGKEYHRFPVPDGGMLFPAYLLNHSYSDCDVFVSLAKMKDHVTTGVTLSMKNHFGSLPCTVYGDRAPEDEPSDLPFGSRGLIFHRGSRQPAKPAPREIDLDSPRHEGYRLPRVIADICAARPINLAIVDGIESMGGAEGPWYGGEPCSPGLLVAGTNCVTTDTVATAAMGYDPLARPGTAPFYTCDNFLELAEKAGLGTRDLDRIEITGLSLAAARFDFSPFLRSRVRRSVGAYPVPGGTR